MRPPVLLRQAVKSVTADRKTCRINSKFAPPIPKNAIGTCRRAMSADKCCTRADKVSRPCRQKTKVVQIAVNVVYTTFRYDYQCVMYKSAECRQNAAKVCMGSAQEVFRSVRVHLFQNLDHLALLRAYNVHTVLQLCDALYNRLVNNPTSLRYNFSKYSC